MVVVMQVCLCSTFNLILGGLKDLRVFVLSCIKLAESCGAFDVVGPPAFVVTGGPGTNFGDTRVVACNVQGGFLRVSNGVDSETVTCTEAGEWTPLSLDCGSGWSRLTLYYLLEL